jgi:hypothetical protein
MGISTKLGMNNVDEKLIQPTKDVASTMKVWDSNQQKADSCVRLVGITNKHGGIMEIS